MDASAIDHLLAGLAVFVVGVKTYLDSRKAKVSRTEELKAVVELAFKAGAAHTARKGNNISLRDAVFHAACIIDVQRDGKRDFDDKTLRQVIDGEGHARGLW